VVRIVDGDTIVVQHEGKPATVRLIGVDTPEEVDPRKPIQYYAKEAARFTAELTLNQQVRLEVQEGSQSRDRYQRLLAYVFRQKDNLLVNKEIIRQGFGFAYLKYPFDPQRMEDFRAAEQEARENKRGLWAPVVDKYHEMVTPKYEPRAESWLKMGDNLAATNPVASRSWYARIVNEYPRSTQCPVALERLGLPPARKVVYPPLDSELAISLLGGVEIWAPVTLSDGTGRPISWSNVRMSQAEIEKKLEAERQANIPQSRTKRGHK
jgi:micrococcal nuclease